LDEGEVAAVVSFRARGLVGVLTVAVLVAAAGCGDSSGGSSGASAGPVVADQGDIAALEAAAKQEGTVVWLTSQPQSVGQQTVDAFKARFGIDVQFLAINSGTLAQRYETEAQSGKISADVVTLNSPSFVESSVENGWTQPLEDAGLPVLALKTFPEEYFHGASATTSFTPYSIWYSKDKLDAGMVPKSVEELADPKYKGMINLTDPSTSDGLVQFYDVLQQKYGDEWFGRLMANDPKFYPSASAAVQAVAGGEGALATPAAHSVGVPLVASGAPLEEVVPPVTTGSEIQLMLTAPDKAAHPNAAKLFANWMLSQSGNTAANGSLAAGVYDKSALPSGWVNPRQITPEIKAKVMSLLGLTG
jgi:iron(III) transport system substrate-binding protein